MSDLFDNVVPPSGPPSGAGRARRPLADRLRPKTMSDVVGQSQLLGPEAP